MGTFAIKDDFYLNGERFKLISGSIHYFRVPPDYWRDRLVKLKNMGCNTVETYIPWNGHEPHKVGVRRPARMAPSTGWHAPAVQRSGLSRACAGVL